MTFAQRSEEILEIRGKQEAKFEEILATLAVEQKLGDLATMTKKDRAKLESLADKQLENWWSATRQKRSLIVICRPEP